MREFKIGDKVTVIGTIIGIYKSLPKFQLEMDSKEVCWVNKVRDPGAEEKSYEDGLNEAWELVKRLFSRMKQKELDEIFGDDFTFDKIMGLSPREAAAKVKAWEDGKEICVGDVVKTNDGRNGVATGIYRDHEGKVAVVLGEDGSLFSYYCRSLKKTGRTIDIPALLAEIRGEDPNRTADTE